MLRTVGFAGFQWLDGSFLEDVEGREARSPKDMDVVSFVIPANATAVRRAVAQQPVLTDRIAIKAQFLLDHYWVNLAYNPISTVELTRYWTSLFSHRRDGVWKGMLRLELDTPADDSAADRLLGSST